MYVMGNPMIKELQYYSTVDTTRVPTEGESTLLALARKTAAKPWFDHLAALMDSTNTGATLQQYRPVGERWTTSRQKRVH